MNPTDSLERELTAWLAEAGVPRMPDYVDLIVQRTAGTRQRPRWAFPRRWLPMNVAVLEQVPIRPFPWRAIALLAMLALIAAGVVLVGGQRRLPALVGPAANGLVAYAQDGDIFVVDPDTGARRAIVTGPESDHDPVWSLDGTRLVFLRGNGVWDAVVVTDADGRNPLVAESEVLLDLDPDSVAWSPDGRSIAYVADFGAARGLYVLDSVTGAVRTVAAGTYLRLEAYWRPPDGRQLMFVGTTGSGAGLFLASLDDDSPAELPRSRGDWETLRPSGWTPDGQQFVFHRAVAEDQYSTLVVDIATGEEMTLPIGFGQVSNDGSRVVGFQEDATGLRLCVVPIDGGTCVEIADGDLLPGPGHRGGIVWSPDDQWIIAEPAEGGPPALLDPDGKLTDRPAWLAEGGESWQRVAP